MAGLGKASKARGARKLAAMPGWGAALPPLVRVADKRADGFYLSREWRGLLARIKAARGNWCERCGAGGPGVRIIGDHKHEIKDGGAPLDERNIELMCLPCHNRKTAEAKARRAGR